MNIVTHFLLSFLFILLYSAHLKGQDSCLYKTYFYYVGGGTISLTEGDYETSEIRFKKAFESVKFHLAFDLSQALKLSQKLNDTIWAQELSIKLAMGGIQQKYFDDFKNYNWYPLFIENFQSYRNHFHTHYDIELREKLFALRTLDSTIISNYHKWRKGEFEMQLKDLIDDAYAVRNAFVDLIKNQGFPCEKTVGYRSIDCVIMPLPVTIILIHIYQRGQLILKSQLSQIVCNGKLQPVDYTSLNCFRGFGNSSGIENEMKIRYEKYRSIKK